MGFVTTLAPPRAPFERLQHMSQSSPAAHADSFHRHAANLALRGIVLRSLSWPFPALYSMGTKAKVIAMW